MKKTYIEPKMQEICLNISNIICGSNLGIASESASQAGIKESDSRAGRWFDDDEE